ncbi:MAG: hypothetical protein AAGN66_18080 [Acidobacteriota bacterium]
MSAFHTAPHRTALRGPRRRGLRPRRAAIVVLLALTTALWAQESPESPARSSEPPAGPVVPPEGEPDHFGGYEVDPAADPGDDLDSDGGVEIVKAQLVGDLGHRWVRSIRKVTDGAGRAAFSRQGEHIAYDRPSDLGPRSVWTARLDDGLENERCLTCEFWDLRKHNVVSPDWHPSGDLLVAVAQNAPASRMRQESLDLARPDRGYHGDLWVFSRDGRDSWQMSQVAEQGGAVLDPRYSFEGTRIAWSERVQSRTRRWGSWVVRVAEFEVRRGVPRLGKVKTFEPPWPALVTVAGWSEDEKSLWTSIEPDPVSRREGLVPARLDLETGRFEPLRVEGTWNERMTQVPDGERRVWASDRGLVAPRGAELDRRHDLWFMSPSGRRQERLTYFNDPASKHALGEAWIVSTSWSPRGDRLLVQVLTPGGSAAAGRLTESLYLVELDSELRR